MRFCRPHAPILFLTTAAVLSFRPYSTTQADNSRTLPPRQTRRDPGCPAYGCPLKPHDVHYNNDTVKAALEHLRSLKREDADSESLQVLQQSMSEDSSAVTLTLIGYKGGQLQEQVNQDRAVVISPFYITETDKKITDQKNCIQQERILLGVFDGHAPLGERYVFAEALVSQASSLCSLYLSLPCLLSSKEITHLINARVLYAIVPLS
jgi:hypothetical protein